MRRYILALALMLPGVAWGQMNGAPGVSPPIGLPKNNPAFTGALTGPAALFPNGGVTFGSNNEGTTLSTFTNSFQSTQFLYQSIPAFGEHDFVISSNAINSMYVQTTNPTSFTSTCYLANTNVIVGCLYHPNYRDGTATGTIGASTTGTGASTNLTLSAVSGVIHPGSAASAAISGTGVPGSTYIVSQTSGPIGGAGVYVTNNATTASSAAITVTSNYMDATAKSTGVLLDIYNSISGGTPTAVSTNSYILSQVSGTAKGVGVYILNASSYIPTSETFNVTAGGMEFATECTPATSLTSGQGCYLPPPFVLRQEWNDPAGGGNQIYEVLKIDQFHNFAILPITPSGWMALGVNYSTGSVGFGCPGNTSAYDSQFQLCQLATIKKGIAINTTAAPSPTGGAGSMGASSANGLELAGSGSPWDVALKNRTGSVTAGVVGNRTDFKIQGGLQVGDPVGSAVFTMGVGEISMRLNTASGTAPGAQGLKFGTVCGTNAGTAKIITYAGTSTTPVTIIDNVGSGVSGC